MNEQDHAAVSAAMADPSVEEFLAEMRRIMEHFSEEISLDLRGVSVDLVRGFAARFIVLSAQGMHGRGWTFNEWMESENSDLVLNAAARQAVRELFGGKES